MAGPRPDTETGTTARGTNDRGVADRGILPQRDDVPATTDRSVPISVATTATSTRGWQPSYTPGVAHNHQPCGRWEEIRQRPVTVDLSVDQICRYGSARDVAKRARQYLDGHPIAVAHFDHYLSASGRDFDEDASLAAMLRTDAGVRWVFAEEIRRLAQSSKATTGWVTLEQKNYANEDYLFAFGGIDRLDYEVDRAGNSLRVWFQDRYEWHPVYEQLYDRQLGDRIRNDNCLHAAMVEMKLEGAADFWMKGKAVISLDALPAAGEKPPAGRSEDWW